MSLSSFAGIAYAATSIPPLYIKAIALLCSILEPFSTFASLLVTFDKQKIDGIGNTIDNKSIIQWLSSVHSTTEKN